MAIRQERDGRRWYSGNDLDALIHRAEKALERRRSGVIFEHKESPHDSLQVQPNPDTLAYLMSDIPPKRDTKRKALRRAS